MFLTGALAPAEHFRGKAPPLNREMADEGGINTRPQKPGQGHLRIEGQKMLK
jgi:hypothetical protein